MDKPSFNLKKVWFALPFAIFVCQVLNPWGRAGRVVMAACAGALIILFLIYGYRWACRKRVEELRALAKQLKMEFSADDPFDIPTMYKSCRMFNQGPLSKAANVIYGRMGDCDLKTCDYKYDSGLGKSRPVYTISFVILDTPYSFPYLIVSPEMSSGRMEARAGLSDVDFESAEFNRKFNVKTDDRKFAYDVIHPRMMEFLLSGPEQTIELVDRSVIVYTDHVSLDENVSSSEDLARIAISTMVPSVFQPQDFARGVAFVQQFAELLPDYLKSQLSGVQEAK